MTPKNIIQDYSFFTEMSALARQHGSYDLSLGLPDFEIDAQLKELLQKSAKKVSHSYESLHGNPELIQQIIEFNAQRYHAISLDESNISVVPYSTFALFTALKSVLLPGDEVIVLEPAYYTYIPTILLNGGVPICIDLAENSEDTTEKIKEKISAQTKAIIINSPHNPTGKIWKKKDWDSLYNCIRERDFVIISEEVYDIYCFDEHQHYSPFAHPELKKRTFSLFSFGKMFHVTGWKVSYLLAPPDLLERFRFYQQFISFGVNSPCQYAVAKYLKIFQPEQNCKLLEDKRNLFLSMLKETPLCIEQKCEGGFFQTVNFRQLDQFKTDIDFAKWLTVSKKVACLPLSAFYSTRQNSDYIRFSFAKNDDLIYDALNYLRKNL